MVARLLHLHLILQGPQCNMAAELPDKHLQEAEQ